MAPAITARIAREGPALADDPPDSVNAYYATTQGKDGVALLRELHDISAQWHDPRTYSRARSSMFRDIEDPDGDDVVTDLYSGAQISGVAGLRTATRAGLTTEHVWPQSEGATRAAKSDLHHLRPALTSLNQHRSNLPYGEVKNPDWASPPVKGVDELSMVGTDDTGTKVFTPRASMRGDLARDQFYFFTRYHGDQPDQYSTGNFVHSLQTLLRWHDDDPVDDTERARNEAIFQLQGNRNPYVDRPGFVDRVGFSERLVTRRPN
jgi:endonuclease I